ncbi:MAG: S46 family peptidase [Crocinitomicaceae bacterium]|nr:S46 family peptidase [Crocinitomicaceae bacterium]
MIKKAIVFIGLAVMLIPQVVIANEGMWLVSLLNRINEAEMKNLGLNLTAEEIYSINNASLKDAVVRLNGGSCTGEVVSGSGLIFTNHHCAYDAIQSLSTVQNDMLTNGFCAKSFAEELPIPGFEISFLVRIEDVTKKVLEGITEGMSEADRNLAIRTVTRKLEKEAAEGSSYETEVKSFYFGNEYYLFVYDTFRDIRLVGNPPESVGKYGGDTDNWMWPRHTGDFSMLRIYADKDNHAADYAETNVPYRPKHFLPVNINGVEEGDFAMIMGYPGSTDRYLASWGVKQALEISNPSVVEIRDVKLKTMKNHMDADPAVRLKYAAKYAQTANYWKYFIGQDKGLLRLDVQGKKEKEEADFTKWVNAGDAARKEKYGDALKMIKEYYDATDRTAKGNTYVIEAGLTGADLPLFGWRFVRTYEAAMNEKDPAAQKELLEGFKEQAEEFYRDFDLATETDVFIQLTKLYRSKISADQLPSWIKLIDSKYKGNVENFAKKMYTSSFLADKNKLYAFIEKPNQKLFDKDMVVMVAKSSIEYYRSTFANPAQASYDKGYRLYVAGIREMNPKKQYAPDANSTMRLTYGTIKNYQAADAVHYDYYTTAKGIMEKRDNSNPEFVVPDKLADLINRKDFGRYANEKGELVVCFISDLDITGGNSGSPVIDGNGNLIGLAFDGNWEAMSGDIAYEPELQRTISVDIRYVMFIIDKLMGGKNIVDEVKFADPASPKKRANVHSDARAIPGTAHSPAVPLPVPGTTPDKPAIKHSSGTPVKTK